MVGKADKESKESILKNTQSSWDDQFHIEEFDLLYRKDSYGIWYDSEGIRMSSSFFLKDDILISLDAKKTLRSVSFKNQALFVSAHDSLIQIGKIVFTKELLPLNLLGEKVTGIGKKIIEFSPEDIIQEVYLGTSKTAYVKLLTGEPFVIDNEVVTGHKVTINQRSDRFEVFENRHQNYWLKGSSDNVLRIDGQALDLDASSLMTLRGRLVAKVSTSRSGKSNYYVNLDKLENFVIEAISKEHVLHIDKRSIMLKDDLLYNVKTANGDYVYNADKDELYQNDLLDATHFQFGALAGFDKHFCTLYIGADHYIFDKKAGDILTIEGSTIANITSSSNRKLLNAIDTEQNQLVLDARRGLDKLSKAKSLFSKVLKTKGDSFLISNKILQEVQIETLGGKIDRIIDLNTEDLELFTIPSDLKMYPEQEMLSGYADRPIVDVLFDEVIHLGQSEFLRAKFESFTGELLPILLAKSSGRPMHIVGDGHRNELVSSIDQKSLEEGYNIGDHTMAQTNTLTEDGKSNQLLISIKELNSWLPFYEGYLPIMRKVVELQGGMWEYNLFELRESRGEAEYLVVEKESPFRILVENKSGKHTPKIVKRGSAELKMPEQISRLKKLFVEDPGYLLILE